MLIIQSLSPEEDWFSMKTVTRWTTKEVEFRLGMQYNVSYGGGEDRGVLCNHCERLVQNIITCRSAPRCFKIS